MINRNRVKSKASKVHPSQEAHHASHWSLVGSRHHAIRAISAVVAIALAPLVRVRRGLFAEPPCRQVYDRPRRGVIQIIDLNSSLISSTGRPAHPCRAIRPQSGRAIRRAGGGRPESPPCAWTRRSIQKKRACWVTWLRSPASALSLLHLDRLPVQPFGAGGRECTDEA